MTSSDRRGSNHPAVTNVSLLWVLKGDTLTAPQGILWIREYVLQAQEMRIRLSDTLILVRTPWAIVFPKDSIPACESLILPLSSARCQHFVEVNVAVKEAIN